MISICWNDLDVCETSFVCNLVIDHQIPVVWKLPWWDHQSSVNYLTQNLWLHASIQIFSMLIWFPQLPHWPEKKMAKILQVTFQLNFIKWNSLLKFHWKRPNSQIPQCTSPICHNVPFKSAMCIFLFWMVHCGLWDRCIVCIVWFVNLAYCRGPINMLRSEAYQNRTDAGWSWTTTTTL